MHNLLNLLEMLLKRRNALRPKQSRCHAPEEFRANLLSPPPGLLVRSLGTVVVLALGIAGLVVAGVGGDAGDELAETGATFVDGDAACFGGVEDVVGERDEVEALAEVLLALGVAADDVPRLGAPSVKEALHGLVGAWVAGDAADGAVGDDGEGAVGSEGLARAADEDLRVGEVCAFHEDGHVDCLVRDGFVAELGHVVGEGETSPALLVLGAPGAEGVAGGLEAGGVGVGDVDVAEVAGEDRGIDSGTGAHVVSELP